MNVQDGLTQFVKPSKKQKVLHAKPLCYTFDRSASKAALMETIPAGINQTPKGIHDYKIIVFDFRGTPIVNIVENEIEVKPPPT